MKLTRTFGMLAGASAGLLLSGVVQAQPYTYTSNVNPSGAWNSAGSWTSSNGGTTYPVSGDTATIVNGDTINITGQEQVTVLTINSGGFLNINGTGAPYAELEFPNTGSPSASVAGSDGLVLVDNARVKISKDMTLSGAGSVVGQDGATCEFGINNAILTVQLLIHGELTFAGMSADGTDSLVNQGEIRADTNGDIDLAASLESVTDSAVGSGNGCTVHRWKVDTHGSARLLFNVAATGLLGSFYVDEGVLRVIQDVTTSGTEAKLTFLSGGDINVSAGKTFANGAVCSGSCGSTSMTGNNNCP